jgi:hypothetical protein
MEGKREREGGLTYPAASQGVYVGAADAAVGYLDVDVGLFPFLGGKLLPNHAAVCGGLVEAHPAFELVVWLRTHIGGVWLSLGSKSLGIWSDE